MKNQQYFSYWISMARQNIENENYEGAIAFLNAIIVSLEV